MGPGAPARTGRAPGLAPRPVGAGGHAQRGADLQGPGQHPALRWVAAARPPGADALGNALRGHRFPDRQPGGAGQPRGRTAAGHARARTQGLPCGRIAPAGAYPSCRGSQDTALSRCPPGIGRPAPAGGGQGAPVATHPAGRRGVRHPPSRPELFPAAQGLCRGGGTLEAASRAGHPLARADPARGAQGLGGTDTGTHARRDRNRPRRDELEPHRADRGRRSTARCGGPEAAP